jgi:hypothetical protein
MAQHRTRHGTTSSQLVSGGDGDAVGEGKRLRERGRLGDVLVLGARRSTTQNLSTRQGEAEREVVSVLDLELARAWSQSAGAARWRVAVAERHGTRLCRHGGGMLIGGGWEQSSGNAWQKRARREPSIEAERRRAPVPNTHRGERAVEGKIGGVLN